LFLSGFSVQTNGAVRPLTVARQQCHSSACIDDVTSPPPPAAECGEDADHVKQFHVTASSISNYTPAVRVGSDLVTPSTSVHDLVVFGSSYGLARIQLLSTGQPKSEADISDDFLCFGRVVHYVLCCAPPFSIRISNRHVSPLEKIHHMSRGEAVMRNCWLCHHRIQQQVVAVK
jgi:hypothetical protein